MAQRRTRSPAPDSPGLARRARAVEWLLLDVDGVMTDGRLWFTAAGEEVKVFHVRDGYGIKAARRAGLKVGILSGRASEAVARRAAELGIDVVVQGRDDKGRALDELLAAQGTSAGRVAYVGDDVPDLEVIERVALSFAPADAVEAVRRRVDVVLAAAGGAGAVREAVERLLGLRGGEDENEPG